MYKKTITYTDYNGNERKEDYYFNLTEAELVEMELTTDGGLVEMLTRIVEAKDGPALTKMFKEILLKAYGEKSPDGRQFMKVDENGKPLYVGFSQTEAYSKFYMELVTSDEAAAEFINKVVPSKYGAASMKSISAPTIK